MTAEQRALYRRGAARFLNAYGRAGLQRKWSTSAVRAHTAARRIARSAGDPSEEAAALNGLGAALAMRGRYALALDTHATARDLTDRFGDRPGHAQSLNGTALCLDGLGRTGEAIALFTSTRDMCVREDLTDGGGVLLDLGRVEEAVAALTDARAAARRSGDLHRVREVNRHLRAALLREPPDGD
jgi:tetratricopeptide (TPR) repeat protein